jgi:hypothetical protein
MSRSNEVDLEATIAKILEGRENLDSYKETKEVLNDSKDDEAFIRNVSTLFGIKLIYKPHIDLEATRRAVLEKIESNPGYGISEEKFEIHTGVPRKYFEPLLIDATKLMKVDVINTEDGVSCIEMNLEATYERVCHHFRNNYSPGFDMDTLDLLKVKGGQEYKEFLMDEIRGFDTYAVYVD